MPMETVSKYDQTEDRKETSVSKEMERLGGTTIKDEEQHREVKSSSELRL